VLSAHSAQRGGIATPTRPRRQRGLQHQSRRDAATHSGSGIEHDGLAGLVTVADVEKHMDVLAVAFLRRAPDACRSRAA